MRKAWLSPEIDLKVAVELLGTQHVAWPSDPQAQQASPPPPPQSHLTKSGAPVTVNTDAHPFCSAVQGVPSGFCNSMFVTCNCGLPLEEGMLDSIGQVEFVSGAQ